ncbi:MAG: rhomboid family intramembrane serine protease [Rubricoccaceae bacterium]
MSDANSPLFRFKLWQAGLPPALRWLLTINIGTYVLYVLLSIVNLGALLAWLALPLRPEQLAWQPLSPLTYSFANLYPGFFGLLSFAFAMLWLNWMGRDYEEQYGSHQMLSLVVLGTLGGAALAMGLGALSNMGVNAPRPVLGYFGAWAAVSAVLVGVATLHPNREIALFLLGVIPLKWIAVAFVILDLAFVRDPTHLGAALSGFLYGTLQKRGTDLGAWARPLFERRRREPKPARKAGGAAWTGLGRREGARESGASRTTTLRRVETGRPAAPTSAPAASEVDRILDKILVSGYDSLTAEEKRVLSEASRD